MGLLLQRTGMLASSLDAGFVAAPGYSNFNNVKFLSAMDESAPFSSESDSPRSYLALSAPFPDSGQQLFGQNMMSFDGINDGIYSSTSAGDFSPQSQDWCMMMYYRTPSSNVAINTPGLMAYYKSTETHWSFNLLEATKKTRLRVWYNSGGGLLFDLLATTALVANTTYLLGCGRSGNTWRIYQGIVDDGICYVSASTSNSGGMSASGGTPRLRIGNADWTAPSKFIKGWFGEIIYMKGESFVTGQFNIPTEPWKRS